MIPRMDGMSLFPFPKSQPSMDFSRRRGPPAPLQLGAAYQAKVLRGYKKFNTPQPLESCLLVDSACDQVIRQSSYEEIQRQKQSFEKKRLSESSVNETAYSLDETQIDSSYEGSEHTLWSYDDTLSDESESRSSCTLSNGSTHDVKEIDGASLAGRFSQAWWIQSQSQSTESDTKSPIKVPAMCRIDQAGVHSWTQEKGKHHRRFKSI